MTYFEDSIKQLLGIAQKDGITSPEELEMLNQIKIDLDSFLLNLEDALEDGIITDSEHERLENMKNMILDRAEITASVDGTLSADEKEMLQALHKLLTEIYS